MANDKGFFGIKDRQLIINGVMHEIKPYTVDPNGYCKFYVIENNQPVSSHAVPYQWIMSKDDRSVKTGGSTYQKVKQGA